MNWSRNERSAVREEGRAGKMAATSAVRRRGSRPRAVSLREPIADPQQLEGDEADAGDHAAEKQRAPMPSHARAYRYRDPEQHVEQRDRNAVQIAG